MEETVKYKIDKTKSAKENLLGIADAVRHALYEVSPADDISFGKSEKRTLTDLGIDSLEYLTLLYELRKGDVINVDDRVKHDNTVKWATHQNDTPRGFLKWVFFEYFMDELQTDLVKRLDSKYDLGSNTQDAERVVDTVIRAIEPEDYKFIVTPDAKLSDLDFVNGADRAALVYSLKDSLGSDLSAISEQARVRLCGEKVTLYDLVEKVYSNVVSSQEKAA